MATAQEQPTGSEHRRWSNESDRVYELLRDDLTAGLFAPGEALVEASLAERYSASRTPVRAAIVRLEGDRLVEVRPHSVTRVRDITARDIRQIYEIRQALEGFAAEVAAGLIERSKLERLLASYEVARRGYGPAEGADVAIDEGVTPLHFLISETMGNGRLTDVLCDESLPLVRMHALYWRMASPRVDALEKKRRAAALEEHRAIAEALLAESGPQARSLVVEHLQSACDHFISLMTTVDLDLTSLSERRNPERAATALDHMIPGMPAQQPNPRK